MRRIAVLFSIIVLLTPVTAQTQESELVVVPAVAYRLPGFDENLWTSEVYFSNPTSIEAKIRMGYVLPGHTVPPDAWNSCPWTGPWEILLSPESSRWYEMVGDLCEATEAVGAYVFEATVGIVVASRIVNHDPDVGDCCRSHLSGFGSELPGIPLSQLPQAGAHLLPALIWHPDRCGPRTFDTYVGFANPYDADVHVAIDLAGDSADPTNADFPKVMTVPALSWQQIGIRPPTSEADTCGSPELFDLRLDIDGPLAIYASVVDRGKQDGRIVMPLPIE